jgi:glucosamine-6-phosphate deaminase
MKIIVKKPEELAEIAAQRYVELLENKPGAVLGFAPGNALKPLYGELGKLCVEGKLMLKNATAFCTEEFEGVDHSDMRSAHAFMDENLFSHTDMDKSRIFYPCTCAGDDAEKLLQYDKDIESAGGMDLVALGIGVNGSIGFNEPATPFESFTHSQQLTDATREQLTDVFGSADAVPEKGVTMGIKTIMSAKSVILIASGEEKADIVYKMVYGKTVTYVPASMLQIHLDMTLYLDEAAASKLN